jgi:hypothetical protein
MPFLLCVTFTFLLIIILKTRSVKKQEPKKEDEVITKFIFHKLFMLKEDEIIQFFSQTFYVICCRGGRISIPANNAAHSTLFLNSRKNMVSAYCTVPIPA